MSGIWILITQDAGVFDDPKIFKTQAEAESAYNAYGSDLNVPFDKESNDFDWSESEQTAAVYGIDLETLELIYEHKPPEPRPYQRRYLDKGGVHCPVCGFNQIEGSSIEVDGGGASQDIHCLKCGSTWTDTYILTGLTQLRNSVGNLLEE